MKSTRAIQKSNSSSNNSANSENDDEISDSSEDKNPIRSVSTSDAESASNDDESDEEHSSDADHNPILAWNNDVTYIASGLKRGLHGIVYQLKFLMFFVMQAIHKKYKFCLATEMTAADKFDDVVFKYRKSNEVFLRFLQIKHRKDADHNKITIKDFLTSNGDFELLKYFISYCRIKHSKLFDDANLEEFSIVTNVDFGKKQEAYLHEKYQQFYGLTFLFESEPDYVDEIFHINGMKSTSKPIKYKFKDITNQTGTYYNQVDEFIKIFKLNLLNLALASNYIQNTKKLIGKAEIEMKARECIKLYENDLNCTGLKKSYGKLKGMVSKGKNKNIKNKSELNTAMQEVLAGIDKIKNVDHSKDNVLKAVQEKLQATKTLHFEHIIDEASKGVEVIKEECRKVKGAVGTTKNEADKVLHLQDKVLSSKECASLRTAYTKNTKMIAVIRKNCKIQIKRLKGCLMQQKN